MVDTKDIATVAALVGDPTRARMLTVLMDGGALTATELALEGGVTPPTASSHLARLLRAGLVTIARQGRHRYFRLASPEVAAVIEGLMGLAPGGTRRVTKTGPADGGLREARVCYDHLAGRVAVGLLDRLREEGVVAGRGESLALGRRAEGWCAGLGLDLEALRARRRPLCRECLDWSERRAHLAGALGAALLERLVALRWVRRQAGERAVTLSPRGAAFLARPV